LEANEEVLPSAHLGEDFPRRRFVLCRDGFDAAHQGKVPALIEFAFHIIGKRIVSVVE
jgi:hypothetical protein